MLKKTITYDDFDGRTVTEDFYFNLTKLEIMEMEINVDGGLSSHIEKLTKAEAGTEVYHLFKDIVLSSVGKKSEDGRRFEKSEELRKDFESSPALGELIFGFLKDGDSAAEFVKSVFPAKMLAEVEKEAAERKTETVELRTASPVLMQVPEEIGGKPQAERDIESYSRRELLDMPQPDFDRLAGTDPQKMDRDLLIVAMQRKANG